MNPMNGYAVSERTRLRVLEAAASLGYSPSMSARVLRGKRDLVLAIVPDWPIGHSTSRFFSFLAAEMEARGLTFLIRYARNETTAYEMLWRSMSPAAVLSFVEIPPEMVARAREEGISVTTGVFDRAHDATHHVELPEEATGRVQVEHLFATGRRRLAIALPPDPRLMPFVRPRTQGVREGCETLGLDPPVERMVAMTPEDARRAVEEFVAAGVDGVCCYNDELAVAMLSGARQVGIPVPDQLAVIGVDDDPVAALTDPALTTIRLDDGAKAARIADAILAGIKGDDLADLPEESSAITLVRRGST
jgi:DNA-binding LacI/PurR family transcriptional regulator